jgi:hypothetical protein
MSKQWMAVQITILALTSALTQAQQKSALTPEAEAALQKEVGKLEAWGKDPELVKAVNAQNARRMTLTQIKDVDSAWIAGKAEDRVRELLGNPCALRLKALVSKGPAYGESFVMDNQGANVCMSDKTSDYWQGDEAKWQKSFNGGSGQAFVDKARYDTSSKTILVQISVPVLDGGATIGALTVGLDPAKLAH